MTDTRTVWIPNVARGDWALAGSILLAGNDLETAVLISLFTDREANPDDIIPDGTNDPRGWWADLGKSKPIGSRLWLLSRAKLTPQTVSDAENFAQEALQWLLDDGIVASIDVSAEIEQPNRLGMRIDLFQSGGRKVSLNYSWAWGQLL